MRQLLRRGVRGLHDTGEQKFTGLNAIAVKTSIAETATTWNMFLAPVGVVGGPTG